MYIINQSTPFCGNVRKSEIHIIIIVTVSCQLVLFWIKKRVFVKCDINFNITDGNCLQRKLLLMAFIDSGLLAGAIVFIIHAPMLWLFFIICVFMKVQFENDGAKDTTSFGTQPTLYLIYSIIDRSFGKNVICTQNILSYSGRHNLTKCNPILL